MPLSKKEIRSRYQSAAKFYDLALHFYGLIGIGKAYRAKTIKLLRLQRGDCIVELGCGSGINFPFIIEQIGPEGRLIGVDISPKMLDCARQRVEREGWKNVELVQGDVAEYVYPDGVKGMLATGVFGYIEDYDRVIKAVSQAILPGGRIVIMDGKMPDRMPSWIFNFFVWVSRPFGVTRDYFDKRTWESVERYSRRRPSSICMEGCCSFPPEQQGGGRSEKTIDRIVIAMIPEKGSDFSTGTSSAFTLSTLAFTLIDFDLII